MMGIYLWVSLSSVRRALAATGVCAAGRGPRSRGGVQGHHEPQAGLAQLAAEPILVPRRRNR